MIQTKNNFNFKIYSLLAGCSGTGAWMQNVALGYYIYIFSKNPVLLGTISALYILPRAFSSILAGQWVDIYGAKFILIISQLIMMVAAISLGLLISLELPNMIFHMAIIVLATSFINNLSATAWPVFIVSLVNKEDTYKAISLNSIQLNTARVIGPILAGWLMNTMNIPFVFFVNAFTFLPIIIYIFMIPMSSTFRKQRPSISIVSFLNTLKVSLNTNDIKIILLLIMLVCLTLLPLSFIMPVYAHIFGSSPKILGLLLSMYSFGGLFGFCSIYFKKKFEVPVIILFHIYFSALLMLILSFEQNLLVAAVITFLIGYSNIAITIIALATIQYHAPSDYLGRISGLYQACFGVFLSFGVMLYGVLSKILGIQSTLILMSLISLIFIFIQFKRK